MALPRYIPHYTVADYQAWAGDWELWSGIPVAMTPSADRIHQRLARKIVVRIDSALRQTGCQHCEVLFEIDWIASEDTVFRPDVLVTCQSGESKWIEQAPKMVVEILSPSTRSKDLLYKREAYAALGVLFYLLVDPANKKTSLLQNTPAGFESFPGGPLALDEGCEISLDLQGLWEP